MPNWVATGWRSPRTFSKDRRDRRGLDRRGPGRILCRDSRVTAGRRGQHVPDGPRVPGPGPDRPGTPRRGQHRQPWNSRSPRRQNLRCCPCVGHCTWSWPSRRPGTTGAARPASTWRSPARSPTSSARTATTTGPEFGPTNLAVHAVSIAVELGDAGQAIELGQQVNPASLSPERQAGYRLDFAQAHAIRGQIGEALHALQESRTHRTRGDPRPLRRPRRPSRTAPALRTAATTRTARPRRTIRRPAVTESH
jgi:hypothetical protein